MDSRTKIFGQLTSGWMVFAVLSCGPLASKSNSDGSSETATNTAAFSGYVNSAFPVTVDEVGYTDMEDFYTKERSRLKTKVIEAGYDSSWNVGFDAQLGLADLWSGMTVFIAPVSNNGYLGQGTVGNAGGFNISLPPNALDAEYQVRAVKRINVILSKGAEVIKICYNFSAQDQSVLFSQREKPIVLNKFKTQITTYSCEISSSSGVVIPSADNTGAKIIKLSKGADKTSVISALGTTDLFVASGTQWCWGNSKNNSLVCATSVMNLCQCSVSFDADGKVASQSNIKGDLLDLSTW